jgi:hypothetical protein
MRHLYHLEKGGCEGGDTPPPVFCVNAVDKGLRTGIGVNAVDKGVSSRLT